MDFRFSEAIEKWLDEQGLTGQFDRLSLPGAAQGLCNGKSEYMLECIRLVVDKHGVNQVILMNHQDCGAYEGSDAFDTLEHEISHHQGDLRSARDIIMTEFPGLEVRLTFAHRNPDSEVIEIREVALTN